MSHIPGDRPSEDVADGMKPEDEARDHAKITAAAAQAPKQVRIGLPVGSHEATVGENDVRLDQIVDCQAVLA